MGDTLGFVSLSSHAWEWTISTNGLMTVRASSAHGTGKKKEEQERAGHWWWYWKRQGAEDGLRFVWRASFYGTQWQQHPVPCHLLLAGH